MSEKIKPLLSIVIPTKNRYSTLFPVVTSILKNINSDQLEIIIQDNSDSNASACLFFESNIDQRLKYFYIPNSLSITDNTIFATENASGKYLIFIGDDDIIAPNIIEFVQLLDEKGGGCLIFNPAFYWWDSVSFTKESYYHRKTAMWVPQKISLELEKLSSKEELDFMLKNGAGGYFKLPRYYHGIVEKKILEDIKIKTGTYLSGTSPDIAFATSIALVVENYYYLDYPLSVYGASRHSGGGMTANKKHFGKIENQKFLPENILEKWDSRIPKIWSERTIYPQTVTEVLKAFKSDLSIDYIVFYAAMMAYEPYLFKYLKPVLWAHLIKEPKSFFKFFFVYIKKMAGIYYRKLLVYKKKFGYDVTLKSEIDQVMVFLGEIKNNN